MKVFAAAMAACVLATAAPASAATFVYRYTTTSGAELAGRLQGQLQVDNNLVLIDSFSSVSFDGVSQPLPSLLTDLREVYTLDGSQPIATSLDGSVQNFCVTSASVCTSGFSAYFGFVTDLFGSPGIYIYSEGFGPAPNEAEDYVAANWRLRELTAVPEPAGWTMLVAGFGLVGVAARRRPRMAAAGRQAWPTDLLSRV